DGNLLRDNTLYRNYNGLTVESSARNALVNNIVRQNNNGINFDDARRNHAINNTAFNNIKGIYLFLSENNTILGNTIAENYVGILITVSSLNALSHNTVTNNSAYGIQISAMWRDIWPDYEEEDASHGNMVWLNVVAASGEANGYDDDEGNQWDNGAIGNYWGDFSGEDERPRDGIGDHPYAIAGGAGAQDRFPLVGFPSSDHFPPRIDHPHDIFLEENTRGHTLTWHASDANPDAFMLWRNGIGIENGTWQGGQLAFKIDSLALGLGVHNFTLWINDTSGYWAHDTVHVIVTNTKIAASPQIIMIAAGVAIICAGVLIISTIKAREQQNLERLSQEIKLMVQQFQETVNGIIPPTDLQELREVSQTIHPQFEKCKAAISTARSHAVQKWLPAFLRADLVPLERLATQMNSTYTEFTRAYLKWVEELMDE
ncbi:MAG: NosD domain-containing protein, partial [Candidatus Hodarchaeales archaeon]